MPIPADIYALSTTPASNSPGAGEDLGTADNYLREWASYIALLRNVALSGSASLSTLNITYTGTLTGGTGAINIGSNQFYKDTSGNIGLGVVPAQRLTIYTGGGVSSLSHFVNGVTGAGALNGFLVGVDSAGSGYINVQQSFPLIFHTNGVEVFRLDASGNIAIQNTRGVPSAPAAGGILYIQSGALKYIGSSGTVTTLAPA